MSIDCDNFREMLLIIALHLRYTEGGVAAAGHLPLLLRDGRGVLPLRRADLRHEVRQLDLRRLPGEASSGIFGCSLKESPDPISALDRVRCSIYWGDEM